MTTTANPAQQAGRPQPTTTTEPPGGPFIRHAQVGRLPQYTVSGVTFGGTITQPCVARPGYFRAFRAMFTATGGVNGTKTVAATGDAPFSSVGQVQMKDSFGTPVLTGPGYEILYLVPLFSGCFGTFKNAALTKLPSWSAV